MEDGLQQKVVELHGGSTLLLAGPGCGKTHILAKRVFHAHTKLGVPFGDMLCLTFTNRAAREMESRIESYAGYRPPDLFIGNIHRFCFQFLFENNIIDADTSVLDEEDIDEFLSSSLGLRSQTEVRHFLDLAAYVYQTDSDHPEELVRRPRILPTERDYERIAAFEKFKRDNKLIDFDRILLTAYTALLDRNAHEYSMTGYTWIQVDEVQDLTPLQLAIVDLVGSRQNRTSLYLGDEQQAIFRFIGAGGRALESLKEKCHNHILRLQRNYRSPRYLVEMCNELASSWLEIDPAFLPHSVRESYETDPLSIYRTDPSMLSLMAAATAKELLASHPGETVAILVRSNFDGDKVSAELNRQGIEHFKVARRDVFKQTAFKTLWSHVAVTANPYLYQEWARLLYQTRSVRTMSGARAYTLQLREAAVGPDEILEPEKPTYLAQFVELYADSGKTFTILDTETTGVDTNKDDVVQIAAVKVRGGEIIPGSEFSVLIRTDKSIPEYLGKDIVNPIAGIYHDSAKTETDEAFKMLADYVGDKDIIVGHNIAFDLSILRNNILRRSDTQMPVWIDDSERHLDTLRLSRLLHPTLGRHRLADLLRYFGTEGSNSHNAEDDVMATAGILRALYNEGRVKLAYQQKILANDVVRRIAHRFATNYGAFHRSTCDTYQSGLSSLADELRKAHLFFTEKRMIDPIERIDQILSLVENVIVDKDKEADFRTQYRHLKDLLMYSESDLLINGIASERLSVMTVHKAKGLEMDSVIIYDAVRRSDTADDYARWLYVACSRAKKRLSIGLSAQADAVLGSVSRHFKVLDPKEQRRRISRLK